ncbi:MAG: metallophosphoesterase [Alphaproteobacteria bacterium]|nr:metallophosphoesterase [Alphaproteobacteria bacterium]
MAIFGDSGCRDDREQDCVGLKWPFKSLAGDMAGKGPDLVIHLGDYIYGGGDHWSAWFHEFFRPARKLLEAAPWVMVRGNHESCGDDAPRGWLLFFDYRPDGKTDTCASTDKNHLVATYAIDLSNKLRLIVADSSKSFLKLNKKMKKKLVGGIENCNQLGGFEVMCVRYKKIFDDVELLAKDKNRKTWFATHVPVFGVEEDDKEAVFPETTAMMMAAWRTAKIGKKPDLLFSGDRHLFQIAEVDGKPFQITVGSGGVNLDPAPPDEMDKREGPLAKEEWNVCNDERFGYLLAARMKDGFSFSFNPLMMGDGKCAGMLGMLNKGN